MYGYISRIFVGFYEQNKNDSFWSTMKKVIDHLSNKGFTFRDAAVGPGAWWSSCCWESRRVHCSAREWSDDGCFAGDLISGWSPGDSTPVGGGTLQIDVPFPGYTHMQRAQPIKVEPLGTQHRFEFVCVCVCGCGCHRHKMSMVAVSC